MVQARRLRLKPASVGSSCGKAADNQIRGGVRGLAARADENTEAGIWVEGRGVVVRNNAVVSTPGEANLAALGGDRATFGIHARGSGLRVINNDATDTVGVGALPGTGIFVREGDGAVLENNRVGNSALGDTRGIYLESGDDLPVVTNRLATLEEGIVFATATGKYRDNISSGVTAPYARGTDAGNNK